MDKIRESLIFTFLTHTDKSRSLHVPGPLPLPGLDPTDVSMAGQRIVTANIFDQNIGTGRPVSMTRAVHEQVTTRRIF